MENEGSTLLYIMFEDMPVLANSFCLIALSSGTWYVGMRKYSKVRTARHSTAQHGRARNRTAPHDAAQRR